MAAQTFHRFPDLPKELRDEIWRHCLPHRVVEFDLPDLEYLDYEDQYFRLHGDFYEQRTARCELWQTSCRNCAQPIITRVCHESRIVALETADADLSFFDHSSIRSFIPRNGRLWCNPARSTLLMHNLECYLPEFNRFHAASVCADTFDAVDRFTRRKIMDRLVERQRWPVCGAYVCIHTTDEAAIIKSSIWGSLGEERVVLVDVRDTKRMARFREFWQTHGAKDDVSTQVFFEECVDDVPKIHYFETPTEFLQDLQIRWLHDHMSYWEENADVEDPQGKLWLMTPRDFDGKEDDPRQADYGSLPGRPFARQLWSPNHDHPLVKEVLSKMPDFQPAVMFRLCTANCLSK